MATAYNDDKILDDAAKMVETLNNTQGTNAKIDELRKYDHLKPLLRRIYDDNLKTHVTAKALDKYVKDGKRKGNPIEDMPATLYDLFDGACTGQYSGNFLKEIVWHYIDKHRKHEDIIKMIMDKNLRIRLGVKLVIEAFPDILVEFNVMLASTYDEDKFERILDEHKHLKPPAYISQKIDGVRLITYIRNGKPEFYSRTGKRYTALEALANDLKDIKENVVLDGEIVALDADGKENFKLTVSEARKLDIQMENPRYKVFDVIDLKTYESGRSSGDLYSDRLALATKLLGGRKHIEVLPQTPYSPKALLELDEQAKKYGWEGLMIRMNHEWEAKRSKYLMKYKKFSVEEYKVISVTVEKMPFPNGSGGEDIIEALKNVEIHHKGGSVWVGSGWSKEERLRYAKNPKEIIGKIISVQYQEEFKDEKSGKYSLRCPTVHAVIGDKRDF